MGRSDVLGMHALILETHGADRRRDYDVDAILPRRFIFQTVLLWAGLGERRGAPLLHTLD